MALGIVATPAEARPRHRDVPAPGKAEQPRPGFQDRIVTRPSRRLRRVARAAEYAPDYTTPSGARVKVRVSAAYAGDRDRGQTTANLFGGFLHGSELRKVTVYVTTPEEISSLCGEDADACYLPETRHSKLGTIVINAEDPAFAASAAHEYGHHVASYRSNPPWSAFDYGSKRWATVTDVCPGLQVGRMGFGASKYFQDPAEGWAEAYAETTLPGSWSDIVDRNLFLRQFPLKGVPSEERTRQAIRRDVLRPWVGRAARRWHGRLRRSGSRAVGKGFSMPLDGTARVYLRVPRGREFDLYLKDSRGRVVKKAVTQGNDRLSYRVCGHRALQIVVRRRGGPGGGFRVFMKRP